MPGTPPPVPGTPPPVPGTPPPVPGAPPSSNIFTWGIKEGTGFKSKLGKGVFNVGEGLVNAAIAPLNPRWWYKAYSDIAGIKATDYGGGTSGKVLAVLSGLSQIAQKVGSVAGVLSLALGIASVILGSLMGAGAACALGSAVCGLIAFIASGVAFVLQSILVVGNLIKGAGSATGDQKKRLFSDIAALIGSALGMVGGGLGINWGGGHGLFSSGSQSVMDSATKGLASAGNLVNGQVVGATSTASQVGQQFANAGLGQVFGTVSDATSEGFGSIAAKHDPFLAQRFPAIGAVQRDEDEQDEGEGGANPGELKSAISQFLGAVTKSKSDDRKVQTDMLGSIKAIDETTMRADTPLSSVPGAKPGMPEMSVSQGAQQIPGKAAEAQQAVEEVEQKTGEPAKFKKSDSEKIDKAGKDVKEAESKLGITGEEPKKPSLFKRFKDWLISKVLNIKQRIKKIAQAAKARIISFTMDVFGISKDMEELKSATGTDRAANEQALVDAQESEASADETEEKARELAGKL
ncbi:MAG: hypothetical protein LC118_03770 [Dehalococcoidia bacterium]|nr:hypothetical protein [Dehalococcoidia bacterium]